MTKKTKIVLDSDVVIHFIKAEKFSLLFDIFPEYQYLILDVVYNELQKHRETKTIIDNFLSLMPQKLKQEQFVPKGDMRKEYARLQYELNKGRGESACMVYCLENNDVLGSSNLKDIKEYCMEHNIVYLTTLDFLYYAYIRNLMTCNDCTDFINMVIDNGSHLPIIDIKKYNCRVEL